MKNNNNDDDIKESLEHTSRSCLCVCCKVAQLHKIAADESDNNEYIQKMLAAASKAAENAKKLANESNNQEVKNAKEQADDSVVSIREQLREERGHN